ncbi:carboxymuconolactone decarboxylase family protein [Brumimicrobium oceani]|uniref:Alkylhydroperoxidase n=1 Tax=Brumimicrobium oceani TaxID=2100725 RepID=A0A2U2XCC8_9FLAO|nr:carboxymuconolactone decarboxylase family protein [Brumimicrobium oceani]PWH85361.1 alkylhydroperoxidase [Brumimicrobium oceani]
MKQDITIPQEISSRAEFKRKFSFAQMYNSFIYAAGAFSILSKNKKSALLHPDFVERLQLAVTEVNGCAACSYQHTKMALKQGMSNEEISSFLSGKDNFIRPEEAKAIVFAQHFADETGKPKKYAYDSIVEEYGEEKAEIILAACQVMIAGNMYGIPVSAFQARLKGNKFKDSSLFYELGMMISGILALPFVIIHSVSRSLLGLAGNKFAKD